MQAMVETVVRILSIADNSEGEREVKSCKHLISLPCHCSQVHGHCQKVFPTITCCCFRQSEESSELERMGNRLVFFFSKK